MRRGYRVVILIALLAAVPALSGCENFDPDNLNIFGLSNKKKLPGKREALFPNGVPGVTQGIPPEYMKGYKPETAALPPGDTDAASTASATTAAPVTAVHEAKASKSRHAAKPRHRVVRRKKAEPKAAAKVEPAQPQLQQTASQPHAGQGTSAPWPSSAPQQTQAGWPAPQQSQAGWPTAQGDQGSQKLAPWPSAPPPGTFSK